jgi:protoporphyrinogen oxidase
MAALLIARAGRRVVVLEASDRVGGMAGSFEVAGQRVDFGSHRLHPSIAPDLRRELEGLLGDELQVRPRHGRIRLQGRWLPFPFGPADVVTGLPPAFAAKVVRDSLLSPFRRPKADTFHEVVRAGLGPTIAAEFYEPYAHKLWDADPRDLAGELARRRVSARGPLDLVKKAVRRGEHPGRSFLYPRTGFGTISERLAEAAAEAGADIRLGAPVLGITKTMWSKPTLRSRAGDRGPYVIEAERVWSTMPLVPLARLVDPAPPPEASAAAGRLRHRAMVLAYLVLDRPQWTELDAHYFPSLDVPMARVSEVKNYRVGGDDPAGQTVLCAELACWAEDDDPIWTAEPAHLGALVADALERQGLPDARPVHTEVVRLPHVYPVYRPGFEVDLAAVEAWAEDQPWLTVFGRQGLFVADNTHHALAMGQAAAACLGPDGAWDEARWRRTRDGFRSNVVED